MLIRVKKKNRKNETPGKIHSRLQQLNGKKIDLSLIYETKSDKISSKQKSNSGYGLYEDPRPGETNQIKRCLDQGYFQYDFPKYLSLGSINKDLQFSEKGTKALIDAMLQETKFRENIYRTASKDKIKID